MAANEILNYCETNTGTNLLTQAEYLADPERVIGNTQFTIARSKLVNKSVKQSVAVASGVAQFIADNQPVDITDTLLTNDMRDAFIHAQSNFRRQNVPLTFTSTGTANNLIIDTLPLYPTIIIGTEIQIIANATNTASVTIVLDGGAPQNVRTQTQIGFQVLRPGEIVSGGIYRLIWNGTDWIIMNPTYISSFIGAQITVGAGQIIIGNGIYQKVNYSTVIFDTSSLWSNAAQQFTVTRAGYYRLNSILSISNAATVTTVSQAIFVNGIPQIRIGQLQSPVSPISDQIEVIGSGMVLLSPSNTVYLAARSTLANRTVESAYCSLEFLGS